MNEVVAFILVEEKKEKQSRDIVAAKQKVRHEIQELNEKLKQSKDAIQIFTKEIQKLAAAHHEQAAVTAT